MTIGRKVPLEPKAKIFKKVGPGFKTTKTKEELAEISRQNGKKRRGKKQPTCYEKSAPMEVEYDTHDMMADIYSPRAKVAPELKIQTVSCYFLTGNVRATSKMTGLNHQLISTWKNHALWWSPVLAKIRKEKNDELDARLTELIHSSTEELKDRLVNGDTVLDKRGDLIRKPMSGRDVSHALNTLYDKRTMLRGDPTTITAKIDHNKLLDELRDEFKQMAESAYNKKVVN